MQGRWVATTGSARPRSMRSCAAGLCRPATSTHPPTRHPSGPSQPPPAVLRDDLAAEAGVGGLDELLAVLDRHRDCGLPEDLVQGGGGFGEVAAAGTSVALGKGWAWRALQLRKAQPSRAPAPKHRQTLQPGVSSDGASCSRPARWPHLHRLLCRAPKGVRNDRGVHACGGAAGSAAVPASGGTASGSAAQATQLAAS